MNRIIPAIMGILLVMSFGTAFGSSTPYPHIVVNTEIPNMSYTETFDVRDSINNYGWFMSPVCGLEMCNGLTATQNMVYQGMTVNGDKPDIKPIFNGFYFLKGHFPYWK